MALLHSVLSTVLSWTCLCSLMYIFSTGLIAVVAVLTLSNVWYSHRLSCFSKPQARSWLLGHLGQIRGKEEGFQQVDDLVKTYKHSCYWVLGPFNHLVRLFHPDYVKPLLMAPGSMTVKKGLIYHHLQPWLGHSVLISNGAVWSRKRRLLTPAFHFDILKSYTTIFNSSSKIMHSAVLTVVNELLTWSIRESSPEEAVARWLCPQGGSYDRDKWCRLLAEGKTNLEMFDHVTLMTLDSLLKCAFSYDSNCQESSSEYVSAIVQLCDLVTQRQHNILHHWDWIYWKTQQGKLFKQTLNIVHRFTRDVVQKRRALLKEQRERVTQSEVAPTSQRRKDFVDILLLTRDEDGRGLTDEEIQAEANTFMFAGHDTTASAICWTLYNLARHEHYQEKCRQEVMDLMEGRDAHEIEWEDLSSLPFTTMCIKESLRLHSPVQAVTRSYTQDMVLPGNRTVPAGTVCLVSIYGTHHNPIVWTNPHKFDPQRFDPSNKMNQASHAFIPFSSGSRNCIGQKFAMTELQVVVALTLLRFRLTPGVNPEVGSSRVRRLPQVVLRAEGGLWLQLEPVSTLRLNKQSEE